MLLSCLNVEIIVWEFDFDIMVNNVDVYSRLIINLSNSIKLNCIGCNNIYIIFYLNKDFELVKCVV